MAPTIHDTQENPEWVLMAKALRGELSSEEQQEFTTWLNQDDSHTQQWMKALEVWEEAGAIQNSSFSPDLDKAWADFCAKAEISVSVPVLPIQAENEETVSSSPFAWHTLFKYAAALVLAAGLAWLGYLQWNTSSDWTQVATLSGERKQFYLPDSSLVTLNGNSTLRYETAFHGKNRQVELVGEGFFAVRKNPEKPFIVVSGAAQTKVLGTSFNVRAVAGEPTVTVAVETGKVGFSSLTTKKQVLLTPGLTGVLSANGQVAMQKTSSATAPVWKKLSFKGASLHQVVTQLETYFSVSIKVPNQQLQQCTFTGTFDQPQLADILSVLAATSDAKVVKQANDSYVLQGSGCQNNKAL